MDEGLQYRMWEFQVVATNTYPTLNLISKDLQTGNLAYRYTKDQRSSKN